MKKTKKLTCAQKILNVLCDCGRVPNHVMEAVGGKGWRARIFELNQKLTDIKIVTQNKFTYLVSA